MRKFATTFFAALLLSLSAAAQQTVTSAWQNADSATAVCSTSVATLLWWTRRPAQDGAPEL